MEISVKTETGHKVMKGRAREPGEGLWGGRTMQGDKGWNRVDKAERQEGGRRDYKVERDKKEPEKDLWRRGSMQRDKGRRWRKDPQSVRTRGGYKESGGQIERKSEDTYRKGKQWRQIIGCPIQLVPLFATHTLLAAPSTLLFLVVLYKVQRPTSNW